MKTWSRNHWTAKEFPGNSLQWCRQYVCSSVKTATESIITTLLPKKTKREWAPWRFCDQCRHTASSHKPHRHGALLAHFLLPVVLWAWPHQKPNIKRTFDAVYTFQLPGDTAQSKKDAEWLQRAKQETSYYFYKSRKTLKPYFLWLPGS